MSREQVADPSIDDGRGAPPIPNTNDSDEANDVERGQTAHEGPNTEHPQQLVKTPPTDHEIKQFEDALMAARQAVANRELDLADATLTDATPLAKLAEQKERLKQAKQDKNKSSISYRRG